MKSRQGGHAPSQGTFGATHHRRDKALLGNSLRSGRRSCGAMECPLSTTAYSREGTGSLAPVDTRAILRAARSDRRIGTISPLRTMRTPGCRFALSVVALATLSPASRLAQAQGPVVVSSPDSRNTVTVDVKDGALRYAVSRDGKPVILPSRLGFAFRNAVALRDSLRITGNSRSAFDETWTQPWGELATVRDHHNELRVEVAEGTAPRRHFTLVVRAFNDGVGFRYELPDQAGLTDYEISDELTEFALADNAQSWWIASNRPRLDRSETSTRCS